MYAWNANESGNRYRYLSILEHFDDWPFGHRACFVRTKTGSIFDTLIYIIFLQITMENRIKILTRHVHGVLVRSLTFKASRLVFAFICGIQNRRELNAALSKLNRFLLKDNQKRKFTYKEIRPWNECERECEQLNETDRINRKKKWKIILAIRKEEMSSQSKITNSKMRK